MAVRGRPYPIEFTDVEMVRERVELTLIGLDRWDVSCLFVVRHVKDKPVTVVLGAKTLRLVRNFYFARHGKRFKTPAIQRAFDEQWCYLPNPELEPSMLDQADWSAVKRVNGLLAAK